MTGRGMTALEQRPPQIDRLVDDKALLFLVRWRVWCPVDGVGMVLDCCVFVAVGGVFVRNRLCRFLGRVRFSVYVVG